jgi:phosphate transport system substrate-binding protein
MRLVGEAFHADHPDIDLRAVPNLSTGGGIKALTAGVVDVALSSRALTVEEEACGLTATVFGSSALVLITGQDNPVDALSFDQLADLYAGRVTKWPHGKPVRVILQAPDDPDIDILRRMSPAMSEAMTLARQRDGLAVEATDEEMAGSVETVPGAIGTAMLSLVLAERRKLKVLAIDGVMPSSRTIHDPTYPWIKTYRVVTRRESTPGVRQFIEFLASHKARAILTATGHG